MGAVVSSGLGAFGKLGQFCDWASWQLLVTGGSTNA